MSKLMAKSLQGFSIVTAKNKQYRVATASLDAKSTTRSSAPRQEIRHPESQAEEDTELHHWVEHPVSRSMHGYIIGKAGSTLKRIKHETGTRIDVQKGEDFVKIKGTDENIERAKVAIDTLIIAKANPTHFLSIPISSLSVTRKLEEFHKVLESPSFVADGISMDSIAPIPSLHITLGVMKLMGQSEIEAAVRFLKESSANLIHETMTERGITVRLKKLSTMQGHPAKARVLYINVQDESEGKVLDKLCDRLRTQMVEAGLLIDEKRPFKMHITLLKKNSFRSNHNTVKDVNTAEEENNNLEQAHNDDKAWFNASSIMKEFGDLDLSTVTLDSVHIMKMGMNKQGVYKSEGAVVLEK
ncbi:hypothetical protein INT43_003110 [Umbelopsis isabellina]|uniref:K Homology domain-containing protein n=1 Tax=Mortierella isabellina TaxID=91625 RepID=A0A8H7UFD6_MORIS|nr:hypothetical protein INT43_003110 [Umbelopsis isabellina]